MKSRLVFLLPLVMSVASTVESEPVSSSDLFDLSYQQGMQAPYRSKQQASEQVVLEDSQWWNSNKPKAIARRREYNECVLKHIGNASTNGAVSQVRYSCRQLHWPHEWPEKYLTQPVPN
ncbi:hypothetical protein GJQ54_05170 [Oceanospirillaceae bacterium ASx5O]|nr:hypothetical protein GJQ54_05170 [Oceanospirillaceae bacterium ASx5O]